eukprot:12628976-Prorocentrum_lima.AAC.1
MGLHVGARRLRLSAGMTRRVRNLEVACSMMRHASMQMTVKFVEDLENEVSRSFGSSPPRKHL